MPKRPDFTLSLKNMETGRSASVGMAFGSPESGFTIYINVATTLTADHTQAPWVLKLFPNTYRNSEVEVPDEDSSPKPDPLKP